MYNQGWRAAILQHLACSISWGLQRTERGLLFFSQRAGALQTLGNLRRNGCLAAIPVLLAMGLGAAAAAGWVVRESCSSSNPSAQGHMPVSTVDEDT